jgi:transcriptional regulator with XRE-family HTH domain
MPKMLRRQFHNPPPQDLPAGATIEALKREFGRRIQHYLTEKMWNQSDLAREATKHMPGKEDFRRDNVSNYVRGKQLPGPVRMKALCAALGVSQDQLVPAGAISMVDEEAPPLEMRSVGEGRVSLKLNQIVDQGVAMQIIALLTPKGNGAS